MSDEFIDKIQIMWSEQEPRKLIDLTLCTAKSTAKSSGFMSVLKGGEEEVSQPEISQACLLNCCTFFTVWHMAWSWVHKNLLLRAVGLQPG